MKQFYACEPKRNLSDSKTRREDVEYDINTLISDEAEMIIEFDDSLLEDLTDEEWEALVKKKSEEIKQKLMDEGIYRNQYGDPLFLYC